MLALHASEIKLGDTIMIHTWKRILFLMAVSMLSSSVTAVVPLHTQKMSVVDLITAEELKAKMSANNEVVIIDVRGSESYANSSSRIRGAIHVNVRKLKYRLGFAPLKDVPRDREVVTYCACPNDEASHHAAKILQQDGFKRVKVLKGGWSEWQKTRGPVEARPRS